MLKILEGDLASFEVPELLAFAGAGQRTGVLVLERADCETKLFFRKGGPVFATSSAEELRLGTLLLRARKLSAQALERLVRRQPPGDRLAQVLLAEKILTEEELASFLKVQVSEIIFHTFTWREGAFTFYDRVPPPTPAITLAMDLQNLIIEGVRRLPVRDRLEEAFPDRSMVVQAIVNPERVKESLALTQDEWRVFFLVDGRRSLDEIGRLAGAPDPAATLEILHHLRSARLVDVAPAPPAAAPADAKPSAPRVEFVAPLPARPQEDDTMEIVGPKAVPYLAKATHLTVARLILITEGSESSFPLIRDTYTLGRHRNNDIVITDPKASAFHARIERTPEGFMLMDLKSRNGCWVNGKRAETALLASGDELRVGMARLFYKVDFTTGP